MREKQPKFRLFLFGLTLSAFWISGLPGQDDLVERVEVVNREVVVRVFDAGEPVPGLTRKDFTLTENGKPAVITSCRQVRRSLAPLPVPEKTKELSASRQRGRLFLFLLWWNEESRDWTKAWNYFLQNIYRPGDRVILAGNSQVIQVHFPEKEQDKIAAFFLDIQASLKQRRLAKKRITEDLRVCARDFNDNMLMISKSKVPIKTPETVFLNAFKNRYQGILSEYRLGRLRAQPGMMERLAEGLRAVDAEKWVLLFLQNERLPMIHKKSHLFTDTPMKPETIAELGRFIDDCDRKMRMATDMAIHVRDLRSLFIGAGATFHLFLSDARGEMQDSDYLRWFPVFSSWESAFRGITKDTGGQVRNTTRLKRALEKAASRADIYYVLTYKPGVAGMGKPKIGIRVSRPGLKVVYARKLRPREILPLKISEPLWKDGELRFNLSDYLRETGDAGTISGDVHVKVSAETPKGKSLTFEKVLHPVDESIQVEMRVNLPGPGDYILTVAARDRLSGNRALNYARVSIDPPEPWMNEAMDPRLKILLDQSAAYCRKLERLAFRFTCTEVVDERVLKRNPLSKRVEPVNRHWAYDYQVVAEKGAATEQRRLVRREHKRVDLPDAKLETRFKAYYSVFLPVTLLGEHNRKDYRYSLLNTERVQKRPCAVIKVTPRRSGEGPLARGRVWVDMDNGAVLKIEMGPRGVAGSAALEAAARKMSAALDLNAVHWYLETRKGLRFPSSAEFSESYVFDKQIVERKIRLPSSGGEAYGVAYTTAHLPTMESSHRRIEFYRMTQRYKKYRYFEVETRVRTQSVGR